MRKLLIIAGVPIDDLNMEETLTQIEEFIRSGQPHQIATVNADFVVKVWDDPELRNILYYSDLLTADGMPLVWGAKLLGVDLRGRVTGADLVPAIAERGAKLGWRVFLLGGRHGVAEKAAGILEQRFPGFKVVGIYSPEFAPVVEMSDEIIGKIKAASPDILMVAFGNPKQEKWIYLHKDELGVPVMIGVGGSLDFVAGEIPRAPRWMQNSGLEWSFRLIQEPRRMWRRYFVDLFLFSRFFLIQLWRNVWGKNNSREVLQTRPAPIDSQKILKNKEIVLNGQITLVERSKIQSEIEQAILSNENGEESNRIHLEMTGVTFIDSSGMGMLVNLTKQARQAGKELILVNVRPEIKTTLRLIMLDQFLTFQSGEEKPAPALSEMAVRFEKGWCILSIPSRIEGLTGKALLTRVEELSQNYKNFIADFNKTIFMDSSGIAAIIKIQKNLMPISGRLILASLQKDVRRVIDLSGVGKHFIIADSVEAGIRESEIINDPKAAHRR